MAEQPLLKWNSVATADTYEVQVTDTDGVWSAPIVDQVGLTVTQFDADAFLAHNTQYWWRARAKNESGVGAWSVVRSFTAYQKPVAPTLVTPPDGSLGLEPTDDGMGNKIITLDWSDALRADEYTLEVSTAVDFSANVQTFSALLVSTHDFVANPGDTYYWRVKGTNPGGDSAWSTVWSFSVQDQPDQVTLVSPANGADVTIS